MMMNKDGFSRQARDKRKENSTKRGWRSALHTQGTPGSKWPISDYRDSYFEDNCYWEEGGRERNIEKMTTSLQFSN
jgi:hypothetical protein